MGLGWSLVVIVLRVGVWVIDYNALYGLSLGNPFGTSVAKILGTAEKQPIFQHHNKNDCNW